MPAVAVRGWVMLNPLLAKPPIIEPIGLRPRDAARALGISEKTLWTWTQKGLIPSVKLGNVTLYPADELRRWLAERAKAGTATPPAAEGGDYDAR